jgi:hypothetical protein
MATVDKKRMKGVKSMSLADGLYSPISGYTLQWSTKNKNRPCSVICNYDRDTHQPPSDDMFVLNETVKGNITVFNITDITHVKDTDKDYAVCYVKNVCKKHVIGDHKRVRYNGYSFSVDEIRNAWEGMSTARLSVRDVAKLIGSPNLTARGRAIMQLLESTGYINLDENKRGRAYSVNIPLASFGDMVRLVEAT